MSPEIRFTKRSRKRLKALKKALVSIEAPESHFIIAGREIGSEKVSDTVYVEARRYINKGCYVKDRFYFHSKPVKKEVKQIVRLLIQTV